MASSSNWVPCIRFDFTAGCTLNDPLSLPAIPAHLASRFDLVHKNVPVGDHLLTILKVRDTNVLVDQIDPSAFADDERLPYWADIWTSSLELARFCLSGGVHKGMSVLELGSGLGIGGIAALRAGARVTLSDYEQDALDFAKYNARRNLTDVQLSNASFRHLDWRNASAGETFDLIIGADIAYERKSVLPIVNVLGLLMAEKSTAVLTEPCRTIGDDFFKVVAEHGFQLELSYHTVDLEGKESRVRRAVITRAD